MQAAARSSAASPIPQRSAYRRTAGSTRGPVSSSSQPMSAGVDEVPGRAQDVGPEDRPRGEGLLDGVVRRSRLHPLPDRPLGLGELLGLHRPEPPDHGGWIREPGPGEALLALAPANRREFVRFWLELVCHGRAQMTMTAVPISANS